MGFYPDPTKEEQKIISSCEAKVTAHPQLFFKNNLVGQTSNEKHL